jgi:hypothetical protein
LTAHALESIHIAEAAFFVLSITFTSSERRSYHLQVRFPNPRRKSFRIAIGVAVVEILLIAVAACILVLKLPCQEPSWTHFWRALQASLSAAGLSWWGIFISLFFLGYGFKHAYQKGGLSTVFALIRRRYRQEGNRDLHCGRIRCGCLFRIHSSAATTVFSCANR